MRPLLFIGLLIFLFSDWAPSWAPTVLIVIVMLGIFSLISATNRKYVAKNKRLNPYADSDDWY